MPIIRAWQDWFAAVSRANGGLLVHKVYLGLGSNSEDAESRLILAQARIAALPDIAIANMSSRYLTEPQGYANQPWFSNMVLSLSVGSSWDAPTLLQQLLQIELELGRVRDPDNRFGPRTIDIDMLLFGEETSSDPFCLLPHPRMHERAFVLVPLAEIAPDVQIGGVPVSTLLAKIQYRLEGKAIYQ